MKDKKAITPEKREATFTAFTLLFPSVITTGIAIVNSSISMAIISIALFIYQSSLLKRYIDSKMGSAY